MVPLCQSLLLIDPFVLILVLLLSVLCVVSVCVCMFHGVNLQLSIFHFNNQVLRKINIAVESEGQKLGVYKS